MIIYIIHVCVYIYIYIYMCVLQVHDEVDLLQDRVLFSYVLIVVKCLCYLCYWYVLFDILLLLTVSSIHRIEAEPC